MREGPWERSEKTVPPEGEWVILLCLGSWGSQGCSVTSEQSRLLAWGCGKPDRTMGGRRKQEIKPRARGSVPGIWRPGIWSPLRGGLSVNTGGASCRASFYCAVIVEIIVSSPEKPEQRQTGHLLLPQGRCCLPSVHPSIHPSMHATDVYWPSSCQICLVLGMYK